MSVAHDHYYDFGPYTAEDLHSLPDEGKKFELVDGWLTELSPSMRHDYLGDKLRDFLRKAASDAGTEMYIQGPMDISTPTGVRRPDVAVLDARVAADARELGLTSLYHSGDVLLAIEIVSRGSGSEREDRGRKVREYAQAGIDQYWIVDFDPHARIQVLGLVGDRYAKPMVFNEGDTLTVDRPFPIAFEVAELTNFS